MAYRNSLTDVYQGGNPKAAARTSTATRPAAPAAPAPQTTPNGQAYTPNFSSGGDNYSSGGGGSYAAPAPAVPVMSDADWLSGDSAYQAQLSSLQRALADWTSDDTAQRTKYNTDYGTSLKDLGWMDDDPNTAGVKDPGWNTNDLNTASGRAEQGQLNDFASRGLLQSTLFGTAKDNLTRQFNDQKTSIDKAKTDFISDRDRQLLAQQHSESDAINQAKAASLARMAAGLAIS